ncbi:protease SohB [uncultured Moraxella sp.]|uniref:protease SohB n=1 Tax=uncultured Moraxella sp. TaxID=263769 RepID=UPI002600F9F0|nr:protease SohB [uncultured Moraxella sp.]
MLFQSKKPVELQIIHLNKAQEQSQKHFEDIIKQKDDKACGFAKLKKLLKNKAKPADDTPSAKDDKTIYVIDFDGDIKASAVAHLREEISNIISIAKAGDEVVLRLESGGGQVSSYGLAAAQLVRIKEAGLTLTVCVDKIAASGGYMMACTANKIIASDFGVLGSVGVVSQLPNFHEFLKKHDVNFEQFTAGEYKRTVTMFGENTDEDRAKYQEDLERIHELFKAFVAKHRPSLAVEKIATGEIWFGQDALDLDLIDEIGTSDAYILSLLDKHNVYALHTRTKPTLAEKLGLADQMSSSITAAIDKTVQLTNQAISTLNRP